MSPRSIGSQRYTNLLTKMRSWSTSEGIILVPSTFTGWYKKMMMNAEIAREMTRSRSHTPNPELTRTGGATGTGAATTSAGVAMAISPAEPGSAEFPIVLPYCIQKKMLQTRNLLCFQVRNMGIRGTMNRGLAQSSTVFIPARPKLSDIQIYQVTKGTLLEAAPNPYRPSKRATGIPDRPAGHSETS